MSKSKLSNPTKWSHWWSGCWAGQGASADEANRADLEMQIVETDAEIDALVYELYGLTEGEIGVVEGLDHE